MQKTFKYIIIAVFVLIACILGGYLGGFLTAKNKYTRTDVYDQEFVDSLRAANREAEQRYTALESLNTDLTSRNNALSGENRELRESNQRAADEAIRTAKLIDDLTRSTQEGSGDLRTIITAIDRVTKAIEDLDPDQ